MLYELHRSAIITGCVNCFCLACESFLEDRQEALCHIKTSLHRESLTTVPYLDKFKDQYIRKFKTGYFCEFCNKLMQTTVHVKIHLCEEYHQQNRGIKLLKPLSRDVTAFNNVLIKERAWHGLIDNVCCICVTEFEDEVLHKNNTSHVLSLIQKPVKFGENDVIYRSIDDSSFHCITCNKLLPLNTMNKHFDDADHLDLYSKCKMRSNKDNIDEKNNNEKSTDTTSIHDVDNINENEIISYTKERNQCDDNDNNDGSKTVLTENSLLDIQFDHCNIERDIEKYSKAETSAEVDGSKHNKTSEINEALDVKGNIRIDHNKYHCESSVNNVLKKDAAVLQHVSQPDTVCQDVNNSIYNKGYALEYCSSNPEINHDKLRSADVVKTLAIDNNMTYNSRNAFCHTCEVQLPFNLKSIKEHIKGVRHNRKLIATQTRQSMVDFVQSLLRVQKRSEMELDSGYLINNKYYITLLSHLLLTRNTSGVGLRCLLCGITLPEYPEFPLAHIDSCSLPKGKHVQIITSEKDEYIREIGPATFHCGFCHTVVPGWSEMQRHLRSPEHDRQKSDSYDRFRSINLSLLQKYVCIVELNF